MKSAKFLVSILAALFVSVTAIAQQPMQGQPRGDQVDQLDRIVDLDDDQKEALRALIQEMEPGIETSKREAQQLQQRMGEHVSADYDEDAIREDAQRLGELTAEITADSVLLQSRMQAIMTEEQLATLDQRIREQQQQMQQMRQQMQQRQGGGGQPMPGR